MGCGRGAAVGLPPLEGGTTISASFDSVEPRKIIENEESAVHVVGYETRQVCKRCEKSEYKFALCARREVGRGQV